MSNHLVGESSPYLQQHVENPVDWYPWGEEAFNLARVENKLIFLSIGYATCHWCHKMEKESFSNPSLAKLMNDVFVNVKVDREEHPQVDSLYMEFAQALLGGAGGWPLNVILTPDLKPVFAVTYLPPDGRHGEMGLRELILQVSAIWKSEQREALLAQSEQVFDAFKKQMEPKAGEELPDDRYVKEVAELYLQMADPVFGGIQGVPKFPMAFHLDFMLCQGTAQNDSRLLFYVEKTLEMMARGGIYDHVGGGFCRYAIDPQWRIPHFEKMLYDNAILANTYTQAWQATKDEQFKTIAEETFRYLLRDMQHPDGGFYSAEDADENFYTWSYDEIDDKALANDYGVLPEGRSVLCQTGEKKHDLQKLFEKRQERTRPFRDEKIITAWNGLAIRSLADASLAFNNRLYYTAASRAASFIQNHLWNKGRLIRRWLNNEPAKNATLEDYAYLISGLLSLFNCDGEAHWLMWAIELTNVLTTHFRSDEGAFYRTDGSDPHLLMRQIDLYDGAEPSGNALHCENLIRLYQLTHAERYQSEAEDILQVAAPFIEHHPLSATYHCVALQRYLDKQAPTLIIALDDNQTLKEEILQAYASRYLPHAELIFRTPALTDLIPGIQEQVPIDNKTTLYLCREGICEAPNNQDVLKAIESC